MEINFKIDLNDTFYLNNIESTAEFEELLTICIERLTNLLSKMNEEELKEFDDTFYLEFDDEEKNILFDVIDLLENIKGVKQNEK